LAVSDREGEGLALAELGHDLLDLVADQFLALEEGVADSPIGSTT
jgi:hypothetical protein